MMPASELVIGTRGSWLALAQTEIASVALFEAEPSLRVRVERIVTTGDVRTDLPLSELGRGIFVSEIERALLDHTIDVAVHSAKDLPSTLDSRLLIGAYLPRADARDVLVAREGSLATLAPGARVGTSSPRRMCALRALRPDLVPVEIRGNVDTRLRKLSDGEVDALLLAGAGLQRLGRAAEASEWLDLEIVIPCVGQGALALEARANDDRVLSLLERIDDLPTRIAVTAERAFLAELGAGCRAAAGAHARMGPESSLRLQAFIGTISGEHIRAERVQNGETPEDLGRSLARTLLAAGGREFLQQADGPPVS
ncbi:MAG TPA: hydroxymethylbilane synthase [Gemmatimonadaceae bacterium]|nr:hydroxymethylbilane synthase [Gemmatimonadaceae bacterium]